MLQEALRGAEGLAAGGGGAQAAAGEPSLTAALDLVYELVGGAAGPAAGQPHSGESQRALGLVYSPCCRCEHAVLL